MQKQIKRVLIANRGEIAVRVAQSLQQMGKVAIAVYSDPDAGALHTQVCDEAYALGGSTPLESYLQAEKILALGKEHQVDAIHPGYGFLSENAGFARRCQQEGIVFIGPSPEVIEAMGDKIRAKATMKAAQVPMVPSFDPPDGTSKQQLIEAAQSVGFPLLVKAAAGGGGKGMRRVESLQDLPEALDMACGEARKAFGDDRVFLERYISKPRHVEIQIFGDSHGNVVYLGERECSIQRRYQKIVEESPSPAVTPQLRQQMGEAAVRGAKAMGYSNAGTVEFLLDDEGQFYFLEVNTRLQVEHPVTEMVYGYDLVKAQLEVAEGKPLPFRQEQLLPRGWALEVRLYAEDPNAGFLPAVGRLEVFRCPSAPGVRLDTGFQQGDEISVYYDPMLAKLVTFGADREEARARMLWTLERFVLLGMENNLRFLARVLSQPEFVQGQLSTHFLSDYPLPPETEEIPPEVVAIAESVRQQPRSSVSQSYPSPWESLGCWPQSSGTAVATTSNRGKLGPRAGASSAQSGPPWWRQTEEALEVWWMGRVYKLANPEDSSGGRSRTRKASGGGLRLISKMPGTVLKINVQLGDQVEAGQQLLLMESMKMEMSMEAQTSGRIKSILVEVGQRVERDSLLIELEALA